MNTDKQKLVNDLNQMLLKYVGKPMSSDTFDEVVKEVSDKFYVKAGHLTEEHGNLQLIIKDGDGFFKFDMRLKPKEEN